MRSNDGKTIAVDSDDGRTFTLNLNEKTTYSRDGKTIAASNILQGATIHFEASADDQDNLTATKVDLLKDPPTQQANGSKNGSEASAPEDDEPRATILRSPVDAPNRPVLHHGASHQTSSGDGNSAQTASGSTSTVSSASNRPVYKDDDITVEPDAPPASAPAKPKSEDLVERAREWVGSFTESLPNYVCQQSTTRYLEESRQTGWQAIDLVTAQVVYEDGKESYRDIMVGGKKTNKSMMELGGSTSTGEFASTLRGLFAPQSEAKFKFAQSARAGGSEAALYDFRVDLHHSDWQIRVGGQTLRPAYSGTVWIDKNTAQVRRIEMQADNVPPDFPLDAVEWAVDYDKVMLGTGSFFLPVHAENLGCQRGSSICSKNAIDFRNYHKFSGESTIKFGQ